MKMNVFFWFPFLSNEPMSMHLNYVILMFVQVSVVPLVGHWRPINSWNWIKGKQQSNSSMLKMVNYIQINWHINYDKYKSILSNYYGRLNLIKVLQIFLCAWMEEWTGMEFWDSLRAAVDRERWKGIVATSSMVPRRPSRLRDWD